MDEFDERLFFVICTIDGLRKEQSWDTLLPLYYKIYASYVFSIPESFYDKRPKKDLNIILADFNAKVGGRKGIGLQLGNLPYIVRQKKKMVRNW